MALPGQTVDRCCLLVLAGVLCASIFIANWEIDEGVISLFTDYLQKMGDLRYLFQHHNAQFSFSWPYFYLLAWFRGDALDADTYYLLRIPSLLLCLGSFFAVHESLKVFVSNRAVRVLAIVFFAVFCLQLGATRARYDSPYLFGASMAVFVAARLQQRRSWLWACPGLLATAFAGTSHPVGLGCVGFLAIVLLCHLLAVRPNRKEAAVVGVVAAVSTFCLIEGLLLGRTPAQFLAELRCVQDEHHAFTATTFLDEWHRYFWSIKDWGFPAGLFVVFVTAGLIWPARPENRSAIRACRLGLWFQVLFLALIPTKWTSYLGLLLPCTTVLAAHHLANLALWRVFPSRRGRLSGDELFCWRGITATQVAALGLAAYLAAAGSHHLWIAAHTNTLLARLLKPNGEQAATWRAWSKMLEGKSINLYSDMTIVPLFGKADFQRHCRWQPDVALGEEIDLDDSGEYLVVSDRHRPGTYGYLERHSQISQFPPQKLATACFFNDTFTIYRIPQHTRAGAQADDRSTASLDPDARLQ